MNLAIKKLHEDAVLPKYAKRGDSGFDLVSVEDVMIEPGETKLIKTGLAFDIPEGYEIQIRPRSGITLKTKLRVQLGTIDSNYRGEVGIIVDNIDPAFDGDPFDIVTIKKGTRIAQGVFVPVAHTTLIEVDELSESIRGSNGYGSTGIN